MKFYILTILIISMVLIVSSSFNKQEKITKESLGELLFLDPILSKDKTVSCASCHKPDFAFADTSVVSSGVNGRKGTRNTPSAMNVLLSPAFFWDGRARSLEEQALAPIENPDEMNLPLDQAILRLNKSPRYRSLFKSVFNSPPDRKNLAEALAAFERTLETSNSPFDEWKFTDDSTAISNSAKRGFAIFNENGKCIKCHFGADFTTHEFRNIGLFNAKNLNDTGRMRISNVKEDLGKFKTPTLRNIKLTAPYMHNGMFATLREVIDFYDNTEKFVADPVNKDSVLAKPLGLSENDKRDLEAFLLTLTDKRFNKN